MQVRIKAPLDGILRKWAKQNKRSIPKQLEVILTNAYLKNLKALK